jgi:hypothetical protein
MMAQEKFTQQATTPLSSSASTVIERNGQTMNGSNVEGHVAGDDRLEHHSSSTTSSSSSSSSSSSTAATAAATEATADPGVSSVHSESTGIMTVKAKGQPILYHFFYVARHNNNNKPPNRDDQTQGR